MEERKKKVKKCQSSRERMETVGVERERGGGGRKRGRRE